MPGGYSRLATPTDPIQQLTEDQEQSLGDLAERTRTMHTTQATYNVQQSLSQPSKWVYITPSVSLSIDKHKAVGDHVGHLSPKLFKPEGNPFIYVAFSFWYDLASSDGSMGVQAWITLRDSIDFDTPPLSVATGTIASLPCTRSGFGAPLNWTHYKHTTPVTYPVEFSGDHVISIGVSTTVNRHIYIDDVVIDAGVI